MADFTIQQITNLWFGWGEFVGGGLSPDQVYELIVRAGGVIAKIPFGDGNTTRVVNYMPNGRYTDENGEQYPEIPRPK
jgi:hypothetical protein